MMDTLLYYPGTPSTRQYIAKSAFTDGFLLMLLNHESAFSLWSWGAFIGYQIDLPCGLHKFISYTEGTALLFGFKWVL